MFQLQHLRHLQEQNCLYVQELHQVHSSSMTWSMHLYTLLQFLSATEHLYRRMLLIPLLADMEALVKSFDLQVEQSQLH
jgi:hypothetical protein